MMEIYKTPKSVKAMLKDKLFQSMDDSDPNASGYTWDLMCRPVYATYDGVTMSEEELQGAIFNSGSIGIITIPDTCIKEYQGTHTDDDGNQIRYVDDWLMRHTEVVAKEDFETALNEFMKYKDILLSKDKNIMVKAEVTLDEAEMLGLHPGVEVDEVISFFYREWDEHCIIETVHIDEDIEGKQVAFKNRYMFSSSPGEVLMDELLDTFTENGELPTSYVKMNEVEVMKYEALLTGAYARLGVEGVKLNPYDSYLVEDETLVEFVDILIEANDPTLLDWIEKFHTDREWREQLIEDYHASEDKN